MHGRCERIRDHCADVQHGRYGLLASYDVRKNHSLFLLTDLTREWCVCGSFIPPLCHWAAKHCWRGPRLASHTPVQRQQATPPIAALRLAQGRARSGPRTQLDGVRVPWWPGVVGARFERRRELLLLPRHATPAQQCSAYCPYSPRAPVERNSPSVERGGHRKVARHQWRRLPHLPFHIGLPAYTAAASQ